MPAHPFYFTPHLRVGAVLIAGDEVAHFLDWRERGGRIYAAIGKPGHAFFPLRFAGLGFFFGWGVKGLGGVASIRFIASSRRRSVSLGLNSSVKRHHGKQRAQKG